MKKIVITFAIVFTSIFSYAQTGGEKVFKTVCAACHTVGKGKIVGPDLKNVHTKYDEKWLISFIKSSQTMVKKGDPKAVKVFNDNNKIPMPDNKYTDVEIKDIIAYIKKSSAGK